MTKLKRNKTLIKEPVTKIKKIKRRMIKSQIPKIKEDQSTIYKGEEKKKKRKRKKKV